MTVSVTACDRNELSEAAIIERLEAAGKTALSLPRGRHGPSKRVTMSIDIVLKASESYGWNLAPLRFSPSAAQITQMEEAWGWLGLIESTIDRRIVTLRAMVHPVSERHIYTWRRLGVLVGADYKSVQHWHLRGIKIIKKSLDRILTRL